MNPSLFDHIPVQIVAVVLGVILTSLIGVIISLIGVIIRMHNQLASQSIRIAAIEAELNNHAVNRGTDKERATDLWERAEKHIDDMEGRIEAQIKEMSSDVKLLVKEMHSEFMRCPNHRAHGAGGF